MSTEENLLLFNPYSYRMIKKLRLPADQSETFLDDEYLISVIIGEEELECYTWDVSGIFMLRRKFDLSRFKRIQLVAFFWAHFEP